MRTKDPQDVMPEGRVTGECDMCPFVAPCGAAILNYMPDDVHKISSNAAPHLDSLVARQLAAKGREADCKEEKKQAEEEIKKFLHDHDTKTAITDDYKVTWATLSPSRRAKTSVIQSKYPEVNADPDAWYETSEGTRLRITQRRK